MNRNLLSLQSSLKGYIHGLFNSRGFYNVIAKSMEGTRAVRLVDCGRRVGRMVSYLH